MRFLGVLLVAVLISACSTKIGHEKPYLKESNSEQVVTYGCEFKGWAIAFMMPAPPTCIIRNTKSDEK